MSVAFIHPPRGKSDAIAYWIQQTRRAAERSGEPSVLLGPGGMGEPGLVPVRSLGYSGWKGLLDQWREPAQRTHAVRVLQAIRTARLEHLPLIVHDAPEMAIFLRRQLPEALITHLFHRCMECGDRTRRLLAGSVNALAATNDLIARWQERYLDLREDSISTILPGVDSAEFHPPLHPPSGLPMINFCGALTPGDSPDLLLRAAKFLSRRTSAFRVQLLETARPKRRETEQYRRLILQACEELRQIGIGVSLVESVSLPMRARLMRQAHLHVQTPRCLEQGLETSLQAMASGVPLITTRPGAGVEIGDSAALLVSPGSVQELAHQILRLLENESFRLERAAKARARAGDFSWRRAWRDLGAVAGEPQPVPRTPHLRILPSAPPVCVGKVVNARL